MPAKITRLAVLLALILPACLNAQTEPVGQQQNAETEEVSVKPGINKKFIDPDLDVDSYVKRFEIESREVFVTRERILAACEIKEGDTVADVSSIP